jgi:CTP:molybdopterin cytidylyltransferase MocA
MGHSIAAAIRTVPADWTAALICLGDMPFVTPATLQALADAGREDRVVAPVHEGRRGNPVAWGRTFFPALAALTGDVGGGSILEGAGDRLISLPVDDPGILIDIDTPEALAAARDRISAPVSTAARGIP